MDFARGARRARHVAANSANTPGPSASPPDMPAAPARDSWDEDTPVARAAQHQSPDERQGFQEPQAPQRQRRHRPARMNELGDGGTGTAGAAPAPHPFHIHRTTNTGHPRLSYPLNSEDDSGSEPDMSVLAIARAATEIQHEVDAEIMDDDDAMSEEVSEAEDTSVESEVEEEIGDEDVMEDDEDEDEEVNDPEQPSESVPLPDPAKMGLKEISNLGKFTVSSHKQGNGVDMLRSDDVKQYWQSDGPQPHKLTVYFVKRVEIRQIRFYVDYNDDESYTPTKIVFKSGTSENNLIEFATMAMDSPVGWQQVPVAGAGGDPDGNTLVSYVLQMQILENHQNGKDTHLRGIKIYAFDTDVSQPGPLGGRDEGVHDVVDLLARDALAFDVATGHGDPGVVGRAVTGLARSLAVTRGEFGFTIPDFMREPELR